MANEAKGGVFVASSTDILATIIPPHLVTIYSPFCIQSLLYSLYRSLYIFHHGSPHPITTTTDHRCKCQHWSVEREGLIRLIAHPTGIGITNAIQGDSSTVSLQIGRKVFTNKKKFNFGHLPPELRRRIILLAMESSKS